MYLNYTWGILDDLCLQWSFPDVISHDTEEHNKCHSHDILIKLIGLHLNSFAKKKNLVQSFFNTDDKIRSFTDLLTSIPKTTNKTKASKDRPWFGDDCKTSIRLRRASLKKFKTNSANDNLQRLKIMSEGSKKKKKLCLV